VKLRIVAIAASLLLVASACDRLPFVGGGDDKRTVLVDYSHDQFASFFLLNFPKQIAVHPGQTIVFRQTWTGEPHTVTGGTTVNESIGSPLLKFVLAFENMASAGVPLPNPDGPVPKGTTVADVIEVVEESDKSADRTNFLEAYEVLADENDAPDRDEADEVSFTEFVEEVDPKIEEAFSSLPFAFDEETENIAQNVGQPCYLGKGGPPKDPKKHCKQQEQPAFDGNQSFYNSGIIPYEGPQGNTFSVPLADDIDPGTYFFYCAVHGFGQSTEVEVRPAGEDIPSQEEVSRDAAKEIEAAAKPLERTYRSAVDDGRVKIPGPEGDPVTLREPFAGLFTAESNHALVNEFVPKQLEVKRNEPITWKMLGAEHTISFGVPRYFPIVQFLDDGTVRINPKIDAPAGGARKIPEQEGMGVFEVNGGTYDGTGFWSSGLVGADPYAEYTMRISKAGTYDFACLIHPPMVGKVTVT
jgi:plastocyanin